MLIKLGSAIRKSGGSVTKETLEGMVAEYRNSSLANEEKLRFSHFKVEEVIQLFVDNGVMSKGALDHIIPNHGMKIYLGRHTNEDNCPEGQAYHANNEPYYMGRDTTIICTTVITPGKFHYADKLKDKIDTALMPGAKFGDPDEALDQSSTYPPDNPYNPAPSPKPDPCDIFDVGNNCD